MQTNISRNCKTRKTSETSETNTKHTATNVKQTKKWRTETNKEFYERFGHWYWFTGYPKRVRKTWIEQYDRSADEDSTK